MKKKYRILLIILILLLLLLFGLFVYQKYFYKKSVNPNKSNIISTMEEYGYTLDDRDTLLMQNEFKTLENNLKSDEINYEEYAKSLSKLFIIDLFTIDNKLNKYDIGSLEYIVIVEQDKFKNIIIDSIYDQVIDNTNGKRNQKLPIVSQIEVEEFNKTTYNLDKESYEAFEVKLNWEYETDLGYDKNAKVILIKKDSRVYVVSYEPISSEED